MKRTLSLILAAVILASSAASCGKTEPKETGAVETTAPATEPAPTEPVATEPVATEPAETTAPAPYDATVITENGVAKAHIVSLDGASAAEKTAAEELAYHIRLVSGAEVSVVNSAEEGSLPIIIATPDSLPEIEVLFPEDLAWLRTLEETAEDGSLRRWGPEGFAIRTQGGRIYIFGQTAEGVRNGVYDFIEENLGVIWITSADDGIIYEEMPTITAVKADYREKSPFAVQSRGGNLTVSQRNKYITAAYTWGSEHNIVEVIKTSPLYDPSITEYWDTDRDGVHLTAETTGQANFWSELTVDTAAASVIAYLDTCTDETRPPYYSVSMHDMRSPSVYPEMTEPYEYAPGQFIEPDNSAYISTVYYSFINKVARKVAEKYPDVKIITLCYTFSTKPPICELEDNVAIWFCPFTEDFTQDTFEPALAEAEAGSTMAAALEAKYFYEWVEKFPETDKIIYNYYFCHFLQGWYERPIWTRIQNDMQLYAESAVTGNLVCGVPYDGNDTLYDWQKAVLFGNHDNYTYKYTRGEGHAMNILSMWLYYKLCWNPYEDLDALIVEFCDKVYGDASPYMQEYYDLLEVGWKNGAELIPYEFNAGLNCDRDAQYYFDFFLDFDLDDGTYYPDAIRDVLTKAWEAADDRAKEFIRQPYEVFSEDWSRFIE